MLCTFFVVVVMFQWYMYALSFSLSLSYNIILLFYFYFFHFRNLKQSSGSGGVQVMCPVSPMLAEACKSVEKAIGKCPQGMYSEIKYDGERIQLHKKGNEFRYVILLFDYCSIWVHIGNYQKYIVDLIHLYRVIQMETNNFLWWSPFLKIYPEI